MQECHICDVEQAAVRHAIMHDVLLGRIAPEVALTAAQIGPYQVLLLRPRDPGQTIDVNSLAERLPIVGHAECLADLLTVGDDLALLMYSQASIDKFEESAALWDQPDSIIRRALQLPDPLLLACGTIVSDAKDIPLSYQRALRLLQQSFFCPPAQYLLRTEDQSDRTSQPPAINLLMLDKYTQQLLQSIQAFNRSLTYATLSELEALLSAGSDTPEAIRLFFADLYLQIKEQMRHLYPSYTIPFYTNTHILKTILQAPRMNDITCFLAQRFDMIMSYIGASSQESVLGSILHYIQHNYASNITLESIAPLFGYNHSYLGKIFRKKMGVSFNEYIDRLRIEKAKTLLVQDNAKVYAISKQVGYKNVDYFHVKFRKYVNMSPVEFRRASQISSNSPDGENSEKGTLFPEA